MSYAYDATTGILTITSTASTWSSTAANNQLKIFIVDDARDISDYHMGVTHEAPQTIKIVSKGGSGSQSIVSSITFTLTLGSDGIYTVKRSTDQVGIRDEDSVVVYGYSLGDCTISQT